MKTALISLIAIGIAIFVATREKDNPLNEFSKKKAASKVSAEEFVEKIESLGYFKFANEKDVEKLMVNQLESFDPSGSWGGMWDDETNVPLDYRYYYCDGEYLYEQGGFIGMLKELQATFDKIGFELKVENHFEEWDTKNEWLNHNITINGTDYVIFRNFKGYGWGEAAQRFAEILNAEFEKQNIEEKIYLISGGNDGYLIFLSEDLYSYFYSVFTDPQWKPLAVKEWAKVMNVKPMNLD